MFQIDYIGFKTDIFQDSTSSNLLNPDIAKNTTINMVVGFHKMTGVRVSLKKLTTCSKCRDLRVFLGQI